MAGVSIVTGFLAWLVTGLAAWIAKIVRALRIWRRAAPRRAALFYQLVDSRDTALARGRGAL